MNALSKAARFLVLGCFSLVLLYCGAGMIMAMVLGRMLPPFPFSWVNWLSRPNLPPLLDHVVNFILTSMVATLVKDVWRQKAPARRAPSSSTL
jgi:hypothetical protein